MVSMNVFAEWTRFTRSADGSMTVYGDFETIKRKGSKVKMWSLFDYKTVQKFKNYRYLSQVSRMEYDCEEETKRMLDFYWYSGNMRSGDIVFSSTNIKLEAESIIPESMDALSLKIACYKK
jgi:activator of HSP90 ATPase